MSDEFAIALPPELIDELARRVASLLTDQVAPPADEWLDVQGAAAYLAAKPQRVYDLVNQRRLKPGRDGKRLLFRKSDLDAYLAGAR